MKVLLVEDSLDLAAALSEVLILAGHTVHLEQTMRGAMDALYEMDAVLVFDCLIADGRFPSFRSWDPPQDWGVEILKAAKHVKVRGILFSGDRALVAQAKREGFTALSKPASMAELLKAVEGL